MRTWEVLSLSFLMLSSSFVHASGALVSSCDKIPSGYRGKVFKIKTDYLAETSNKERPWECISFKEEPQKYAYTTLKYIYDGNIDCDFDLHCNKVANWYHAPWMHYGINGREFVNGLQENDPLSLVNCIMIKNPCYKIGQFLLLMSKVAIHMGKSGKI
ncbi:hypothetical protein OZD61_04185 [Wolbachia endosymbiont of Drosophila bocki]|uniref:hypothetical protein n=1 Tax=Wolbachia endosymbiont of Drosophila bocki TaxID=3002576 RepID=UPI0023A95338|nr:hypothetical protein [Wolbachia endosymbiont of Drosophila bocki]MDE5057966.1 hypothetical protein [Wolbachia endosymbiont of Drosophila bocki]